MDPQILALVRCLAPAVPARLHGTRAAIFYLMAQPRIVAPDRVSAQVGATFGRTMRVAGPAPRGLRPTPPEMRPPVLPNATNSPAPSAGRAQMATDAFIFHDTDPQPRFG